MIHKSSNLNGSNWMLSLIPGTSASNRYCDNFHEREPLRSCYLIGNRRGTVTPSLSLTVTGRVVKSEIRYHKSFDGCTEKVSKFEELNP